MENIDQKKSANYAKIYQRTAVSRPDIELCSVHLFNLSPLSSV